MSKKIELIPVGNSVSNATISGKVNEIIEAVNTLREDMDRLIENESQYIETMIN